MKNILNDILCDLPKLLTLISIDTINRIHAMNGTLLFIRYDTKNFTNLLSGPSNMPSIHAT